MPTDHAKRNEMTRVLNSLISVLLDSQKGFAEIGDHLTDSSLKQFFLTESLTRAGFRGVLEEVLHQNGVHDLHESGTALGALHRAWGDLKARFGAGDHALLETAQQGEVEASDAYRDALDQDLPLPVRQTLAGQMEHVLESHDYIRDHRNALAAG
ncbi:MAG: PA2169 family four-helix-bundle protein [Edaphobacter sp.]|uniref:PA2169 family four-helix-bundle protein n=1 Tax=Edaphobacter sp. TaxID=1934404 RepID=UPI00238B0501|nr:PA2169 family four-helix-bundle protein [Edaphobacter sp.]MDE1176504.1 PA2169 family four-helix-bundle protein [Edaphobacter sp.]